MKNLKNASNEKNIKTVIITGGNTGLGYELAKEIAAQDANGWHVVLACRNQEKAASAVKNLIAETGNRHIEAMELDLASLDSVRKFAENFAARRLPLHALVGNAGLQVVSGTTYTADGFETTFGVNHLGHFLLVNLLLEDFESPARIVMVSSDTHDATKNTGMPPPVFEDAELLAHPKPAAETEDTAKIGRTRYTTSKLSNIFFAYELSRRLHSERTTRKNPEITVNAFNPGIMPGSGLGRDASPVMRFAWNVVLPAMRFLGMKVYGMTLRSVQGSGKDLARVVTDPQLEQVTGKYFDGANEIPSSEESYDLQKARDLWEQSAELVKLAPREDFFSKPAANEALAAVA